MLSRVDRPPTREEHAGEGPARDLRMPGELLRALRGRLEGEELRGRGDLHHGRSSMPALSSRFRSRARRAPGRRPREPGGSDRPRGSRARERRRGTRRRRSQRSRGRRPLASLLELLAEVLLGHDDHEVRAVGARDPDRLLDEPTDRTREAACARVPATAPRSRTPRPCSTPPQSLPGFMRGRRGAAFARRSSSRAARVASSSRVTFELGHGVTFGSSARPPSRVRPTEITRRRNSVSSRPRAFARDDLLHERAGGEGAEFARALEAPIATSPGAKSDSPFSTRRRRR